MENVASAASMSRHRAKSGSKQTSWEELERQDWHLWILATLLMLILGISLLSFMYPTVFWLSNDSAWQAQERAFFGFCVLLSLGIVYMLQRQATVRRLRRQLFEAKAAVEAVKIEATIEAFRTLPGTEPFRDMLAMQYRRASTSGSPLGGAVFVIPKASLEAMGRMVHLLRSMLRRGESLYRVSDKALGVILPNMPLSDVACLATQVEQLSGIPGDEEEVRITSFPDDADSLAELERRLRGSEATP